MATKKVQATKKSKAVKTTRTAPRKKTIARKTVARKPVTRRKATIKRADDLTMQPPRQKSESEKYIPQEFEAQWFAQWQANQLYKTAPADERPKAFILDFFPYP